MEFKNRRNLWLPYSQMKTAADPIEVVATDGVRLTLADGRTLIDGIASWWTACHGYRPPTVIQAIVDQASMMPHMMMGGAVHAPAVRLASRLAERTLGENSVCFFSESGSVAVEVALKIAVQHWMNRGEAQRKKFVCFEGAYHGDTTGAMSVCDAEDSMHSHFKGYLLDHYQSPIPETEAQQHQFAAWLETRSDQIAGIIVEPLVQMAAGMRMHSPYAVDFIRHACDRHGLLMIADEIATGFGRTGSLFAFEQTNSVPDLLCVGKALTGGTTPLAATIAADSVYAAFHTDQPGDALMHGPTFTGHALASAAANASMDLFEPGATEDRLAQVANIESVLESRFTPLRDLSHVRDVRVRGAIGVVQLDEMIDVDSAMHFFRDQGCFVRPLRDAVYLTPSFPICERDLNTLCDAVGGYCAR